MFFEPIIHRTLTKILKHVDSDDEDVSEVIEERVVEENPEDVDLPIGSHIEYQKSELFKFFVQYRG